MKFDKLSLFADGVTIPTTANGVTYSKVLDLRKCGQVGIDGMLRIWGGVVGALDADDVSKITTKVEVSADGLTWTSVVSQTQNSRRLIAMFVPCVDMKRFVRLTFTVGGTALDAAVTVKAGLVDQFDIEDLPKVEVFAANGSGLVDLTNDAMETALVCDTTKTITKGSNADVSFTKGMATVAIAPTSKYTLTLSANKVNIALAADAATGNVVLVDGLGNKVTIAVTAQAAG